MLVAVTTLVAATGKCFATCLLEQGGVHCSLFVRVDSMACAGINGRAGVSDGGNVRRRPW